MEKRFYLINLQCKPKSQKLLTPVEQKILTFAKVQLSQRY